MRFIKRLTVGGLPICALLCVAALFLLSACGDPVAGFVDIVDEYGSPTLFTATIEGGGATKTTLGAFDSNERAVYWSADDSISIRGAIYKVSSGTGTTTATFTGSGAVKDGDFYKAYYPASVYSGGTPSLPAEHIYVSPSSSEGNRVVASHLPMYAKSSTTGLEFKNLCAVLNFKLTGTGKVTKVVLSSAGKNLSGPIGDPDLDGSGNPTFSMTGTADADKTVTLDCGTGVLLDDTTPVEFCIPVPGGVTYAKNDLTVTVYDGTTLVATFKNSSGGSDLVRSNIYEVDMVSDYMELVVESNATNGTTYRLPFVGTFPATTIVYWDYSPDNPGIPQVFNAGDNAENVTRTYATDGEHTIRICVATPAGADQIPHLRTLRSGLNYTNNSGTLREGAKDKMLKRVPTPLLKCRSGSNNHSFTACVNLESIPGDLFAKHTHWTSFAETFRWCEKLASVPDGLFDHNPAVTSFQYTFYGCTSLSSIPSGLFDHNPVVTNFNSTFESCTSLSSIPSGLFDHNPAVTDFSRTFAVCASLSSIPSGLFDHNPAVTNFEQTFVACGGLSSIPPGLFDHNPAVTDFGGTFYNCGSLSSIPSGLFDHNPAVTSFRYTFAACGSLSSIPPGLFDHNPAVTNFDHTFFVCTSLSSIPSGLFDHNPAVTNFNGTFLGCGSLSSIPSGLFDHNPAVTNFGSTFYNCGSLSSIPPGLFDHNPEVVTFDYTFFGCRSLSSIPSGLFDHNPAVTNFGGTFYNCGSLSSIPSGLFDHNPVVTDFSNTFAYCNLSLIPSGLFDHNPAVTSFKRTFERCLNLLSVPGGLFAYNGEVTDFTRTFNCCRVLVVSDDVFINPGAGITSANRFAAVSNISFKECFAYCDPNYSDGRKYVTYPLSATGGTAPALWNYTYAAGVTPDGTRCFAYRPADLTATAGEAIPAAWK